MMVASSYKHSALASQHLLSSSSERPSEKRAMGFRMSKPRSPPAPGKPTRTEKLEPGPAVLPQALADAVPVHSKPVVIPTGGHSAQHARTRGGFGGRRRSRHAIPAAVAALLAVTSIPPPRHNNPRSRTVSPSGRRISIDELIQEWREADKEYAGAYGSPLDILLERPDDSESDDVAGSESSDEQEHGFFLSSRSDSGESVPGLEPDEQSYASWSHLSTPATPASPAGRRPAPERKEKTVCSPRSEEVLDHPLLHLDGDEDDGGSATPVPDVSTRRTSAMKLKASLKSNLTASLQALRSAARSFSNFTAPSVPPEDLLTRSLLSPLYTSEMRPKPIQGVPEPAFRRYLNPTANHVPLSVAELSRQLHEALSQTSEDDSDTPMIQMQTYDRRGRSARRRRAVSPSGDADAPSEPGRAASPMRQREPRENSDFLRVIVLEMNMRREGKLDAKAVGRARIWLPPRKSPVMRPQGEEEMGSVPLRWVGILADEC